jgi:spore germination protein YaaH
MGNQAILPDCRDVDPDANLCIPPTCQTYRVSTTDTCTSIEKALSLERGSIRAFNSWLTFDCRNLQSATDYYGKTICVSPQGGTFTGTLPAPLPTSVPELGDGYTRTPVAPPGGVTVTAGTTLNCGKWYVVQKGDTCTTICVQGGIAASLFRQVNPSIKEDICDASLKVGTAVCVGPTYSWNVTVSETPSDTTGPVTLPTKTGSISSAKAASSTSTKVVSSSTAKKSSATIANPTTTAKPTTSPKPATSVAAKTSTPAKPVSSAKPVSAKSSSAHQQRRDPHGHQHM